MTTGNRRKCPGRPCTPGEGVATADYLHRTLVGGDVYMVQSLRYGELWRCGVCEKYWYADPALSWLQTVEDHELDIISQWNKQAITLPDEFVQILSEIGGTGADIYGNGAGQYNVPCRIVTLTQEATDLAIVRFQKTPPMSLPSCRLASEIAEIHESRAALPWAVREASTRSEETAIGRALMPVIVDNNIYSLNWTVNFFAKNDHEARNVRLYEGPDDVIGQGISEPHNRITYFIADPDPRLVPTGF